MVLIVNDYLPSRGGAGEIALLESSILGANNNMKYVCQKKANFISILWKNIYLLYWSFFSKKIIVHTYSSFPVLKIITMYRNVLHVVHDYGYICPAKSLYNSNENKPCKVQGYSLKCYSTNCGYSKLKKSYQFITRPSFHAFRFLSPLSKSVMKPYKGEIIPNIRTFPFLELKVEKDIDLLFVGRYSIDKGYDRFIQLAQTNPKLRAVSLGAGPLKSNSYVEDRGWVKDKETIMSFVARTRLLVYPSRQLDADPIIVKLALSLSVPVIIDSFNAHKDLVSDQCGLQYVIDNWDVVSLKDHHFRAIVSQYEENLYAREEELKRFYSVD